MAKFVALGQHVPLIELMDTRDKRHPLNDFKAISTDPNDLLGVVGEKTNAREPKVSENLSANPVFAKIGLKA